MDFAVDTLLKTVISAFGRPADYLGGQVNYYQKISELKKPTNVYTDKSNFQRTFDEVVGIYNHALKGLGKQTPGQRREIDTLHDLRNAAQHKGESPDSVTVRLNKRASQRRSLPP